MSERVLVFGEALLDDFGDQQIVGGAPFNVARNLTALGLPALMVTRVGNDAYGDQVRDAFAAFGMSAEGLQHGRQPTGRVLVERDGNGGHRFHILAEQAYDHIETAAAVDVMRAFSPNTVYFGTLAQREAASRAALNAVLAGADDAEHFLDLNLRDGADESVVFDSMQQADIVKVNEDELQALFSWYCHTCPDTVDMDCAAVEAEARAMMHNFSLQGLLVTLGERGAMFFGADGTRVVDHCTSKPAQFVDSVGAGDAFAAVFLAGRARGWETPLVLARANAFAGAVCGIAGAVSPDPAFYAPWRSAWGLD
ncbi:MULTISPECIES: PfkB family carbohydrate kinase [unclassified Duganella]|uniref:PfkB family carbohydrate kinase n=1 Tax=unclassified Duganella TaxID=2636909 RepID=UPI0006F93F1D|nr:MULTISPECIES: PfkB family carbohydrate kinase [unclassified Duganella]KQV47754.1 fructokinase [Duganella sp. Root336D2]KRB81958.1 fructokinase [Duganella sp. Root198D2]